MPAKLMRAGNAAALLRFYIKAKMNFELTCSNYTIALKTTNDKNKFVNSLQSLRTFAAYAKIKSNIKDKPVPEIDREKLRYFQHDFKTDLYIPQVYNLDLKSAYASILHNDGYITAETMAYLMKCKKNERLASVGMLASKKHIFDFKNGKAQDMRVEEAPTANFFFHAVKRTDEIMSIMKMLCGQAYLFTWVDGIYFSDPSLKEELIDYCASIGMICSYEILEHFTVRMYAKKCIVTFYKDGVRKEFNLPLNSVQFKKLMLEAMQMLNAERAEQAKQNPVTKTRLIK